LEALNFICHSDAQFTNCFLRRNIIKFPEELKKRAYQAIVRPNVEYASSAWDPYQENIILKRLKLCKEDLPVSLNTSKFGCA
jgi:hypothetical protein